MFLPSIKYKAVCKNCGQEFEYYRNKAGRPREFCSTKCYKHYNYKKYTLKGVTK